MKVAQAQNKAAMSKLGETITQINLQTTASRQKTSQAIFNNQIQTQQALSQVGLQAAASDTVGASVKDAVSTVQISSDRNEVAARRSQAMQEEGFFMQKQNAIQNTRSSMDWESGSDKLFNNVLSVVGSAAGQAAINYGMEYEANTDAVKSDGPAVGKADFGYDLWGNKAGAAIQSWKSYLG
jgi:hypothetical protein